MLSGKTKQVVLAVAVFTTIAGQSMYTVGLHDQLQKKSEDLIRLNTNLKELDTAIDKLDKENDEAQSYIIQQEEKYKKIEEVMQENSKLQAQNEEIKKQNELLSRYQLTKQSLSRGGDPLSKHVKLKKITVEVSMYSRQQSGNNKTKSGKRPEWGMIAAPKEISMGTKMIIPNDPVLQKRVFTVEDRGGYIKKVGDVYRIDVFVETTAFAIEYGRKYNTEAYIVELE
jgi:3D (Asp-Asp-Asp) domain-containing protein